MKIMVFYHGFRVDASSLAQLTMEKFKISSLEPICAAVETSTQDTSLFWNLVGALRKVILYYYIFYRIYPKLTYHQVFESNFPLADALLEHIPICFTNTLLKLASKQPEYRIFMIFSGFKIR